ncbi:pyridoxamine 5'-phosphate oxidase family protein [Microbacterium rhizosphaerae]|uniref:Pyridoxamine 5'-phosphate oxidase family protein n=1 Tax=Microbacterium rhizosphaerae TaxID=1678237 RepID=A0ABZ0SJP2_9MICO|nr:pyridoxamine 5'-phosphate oxidase family protein [Microbacterium rhizosphaerae]WPR89607.1 pyridoxamine 5'-phosphate oxidase family protein [Microbacterium rhizosphaerae]
MSAHDGLIDPAGNGVEELDAEECWRLLTLGKVGRLAVVGHDGHPDLMPLNYLAHDGSLYFRTAPGGKLQSIEAHPEVAFEIDGQDARRRWSVVVRGSARRLTDPAEIDASGIAHLMSWSPTTKQEFVRVDPSTVSGRRFAKRFETTTDSRGDAAGEVQEFTDHDGVLPKPWPIPHHPPAGQGA